MKIFVFVLLIVNLFQVLLSANPHVREVNSCVEDSICAYQYYGDNSKKYVNRCTCPMSYKCIQQEDDLDLAAHIFRCKPSSTPIDRHGSTCGMNAICAYEYYGADMKRTMTRCTCPSNLYCEQQEDDLDLLAHIFRCKPQAVPPLENFCDKNAICAYKYLGNNIDKTRCKCLPSQKCLKQEVDPDLSAYIFRCKPSMATRIVTFCDDNAICAYGYYGDNLDKTVYSHKLSR